MVIIYIKSNSFVKNIDVNGKQIDYDFETIENKDGTIEVKDIYLENGFTKVELEDKYFDCIKADFNEDLTFNVEKYNARKEQENKLNYKKEVERLISLRYDIYDELAIQRQKDTKPEEFAEYNDYVEECKRQVKEKLNLL